MKFTEQYKTITEEFEKMSDKALIDWLKKNDTEEGYISNVFGRHLLNAKKELKSRGLKIESIQNENIGSVSRGDYVVKGEEGYVMNYDKAFDRIDWAGDNKKLARRYSEKRAKEIAKKAKGKAEKY